jgi:hypothetical protein
VLSQLFGLILGEVLLVARLALEGKGVDWILRVLLMVDIALAILPVRE